jgi:hypothetical protein
LILKPALLQEGTILWRPDDQEQGDVQKRRGKRRTGGRKSKPP